MSTPNLWIAAAGRNSVGFGLAGDTQVTRGSSGAGGWQVTDRPRRGATTEWVDYGPRQLTMSLILDGYSDTPGVPARSVEMAAVEVESWELPVPGSVPPLPPIVTVTGPVPHNELQWVVQTLSFKEAIRDPQGGYRVQQNLDIVLWEYVPPSITTQAASPAAAAASTPAAAAQAGSTGNGSAAHSIYTVKSGDTLETIASVVYGSYTFWTLLANANKIRDPGALQVGQVLSVPAKTANPPAINLPSTPAFISGL